MSAEKKKPSSHHKKKNDKHKHDESKTSISRAIKSLETRVNRMETLLMIQGSSKKTRAIKSTATFSDALSSTGGNYSQFLNWITPATLSTLSSVANGPYTVFVPTNEALDGVTTIDNIIMVPTDLSNLGSQPSNQAFTATNGKLYNITSDGRGKITITDPSGNQATIVNPDIPFNNGTIHGIDNVLV